MRCPRVQLLVAVCAYLVVALAFNWPLPRHLPTHLTGPPSGDTGVYVWNLWVFHHEAIQNQQLPFFTSTILSLSPTVDLSLHNYTTFANLLALPLVSTVGIIASFNLVYLALVVMTAAATFFLVRTLLPARQLEAWIAGLLFGFSPVLVARSTAHFSLVAAAPLPVFILMLLRAERTGEWRYAIGAGLAVAWAAFCDVYYAIYCLVIALCFLVARLIQVSRAAYAEPDGKVLLVLDLLIVVSGSLVAALLLRGGGVLRIYGMRVSVQSLYTPVLVLTVLALARALLASRVRVAIRRRLPRSAFVAVLAGIGAMVAGLSPVLYAFGRHVLSERGEINPPLYWRSSPPGVDLLALVLPNPNQPLFGAPFRDWIVSQRPDGFAEFTASVPYVVLAVVGFAAWRTSFQPPRFWVALTGLFGLLALGPFIHVAGHNTHVPGPWALVRYLPVIGLTRSPARFAIPMMLGFAVLLAFALSAIADRWPQRRRWIGGLVTAALLFELWPAPRTLYSAEVPAIYTTIARDPREVRVLELPFGVRDGASSMGDFSAITQFYQTAHGKAISGGYLSRVSNRRKRLYRRIPVFDALMTLSERVPLTDQQRREAFSTREQFFERSRLGYVVMDDARVAPALRDFAIDLLQLRQIASDHGRSLWVPQYRP